MTLLKDIFRTTPLTIMLDRSRDATAGRTFLTLAPARIFQVTENRRRLTGKRLRAYDVLVVCGNSLAPHGPAEREAIRDFVRRGGGLFLAANAGAFELGTGRPADALGANSVAQLFGFSFLTAADLPADIYGQRGYSREDLVLTREGRRLGPGLGEIRLKQPGPLAVPPLARVLLRRRGGHPVAATARHGRGQVLVLGDIELAQYEHLNLVPVHWLLAIAPRRRRPAATPPRVLGHEYQSLKRDGVTLHFTPPTRKRAREVLALAGAVATRARRLLRPGGKTVPHEIFLEPGCGWQGTMPWETDTLRCSMGADLRPETMTAGLADFFAGRIAVTRLSWNMLNTCKAIRFYVQQHVLEDLGFSDYAAQLREACQAGPPVDLGRAYPWAPEPARLRRFWLDASREFGPGTFRRFIAAIPRKEPLKPIDPAVFSEFDRCAYLLACAVGPRAYRWLARQGHTLRRIPLKEPASEEFKKALRSAYRRLLSDEDAPAADRCDALNALAREDVNPALSVRRARSANVRTALPAAVRMLQARDERGAPAVGRFLRHRDRGLAAAAALCLAEQTHNPQALDFLAEHASQHDVRFQLAAGYALECAGDRRARRLAFDRLPGCGTKISAEGLYKVFLTVDGYEVANTWCEPFLHWAPGGSAYSCSYVEWVHTAIPWRRRGLARMAMARSLENPWNSRCATSALHTGTRFVAHPLYRELGYHDSYVAQTLSKPLRRELLVRPPHGVRLRPATARDAAAIIDLVNEQRADYPTEPLRLPKWPRTSVAYVAHADRRLVGAALAESSGKQAQLQLIAAAEPPKKPARGTLSDSRRQTGLALLSRVHRTFRRRGSRTIRSFVWRPTIDDFTYQILAHAGYSRTAGWGCEMTRIHDLAQFLRESAPAYEQRLAGSKEWGNWSGTLVLDGGRLQAVMEFNEGKLQVSRRARRGAAPQILIRGNAASIQRIVMGTTTPFEEYLQQRCRLLPTCGPAATRFLEHLFPRRVPDLV